VEVGDEQVKRVLKYNVPLGNILNAVDVPIAAKVKHVAWDPYNNCVGLWMIVPTDSQDKLETRYYQAFATGDEVLADMRYVGTAVIAKQHQEVWHVFERETF
jgi:hypothetical protein